MESDYLEDTGWVRLSDYVKERAGEGSVLQVSGFMSIYLASIDEYGVEIVGMKVKYYLKANKCGELLIRVVEE